jgi:hypothetical protein
MKTTQQQSSSNKQWFAGLCTSHFDIYGLIKEGARTVSFFCFFVRTFFFSFEKKRYFGHSFALCA